MESKPGVWLNNQIIPWEDAHVSLLSHGFSRGSAIFEVFGTYPSRVGTKAFRMDKHLERLSTSVKLLGMEMKYSTHEIASAVSKLARNNNFGRGIVKILSFWGEEAAINLLLDSKLDVAIFTIPESQALNLDQSRPITACFSKWRKLHPETVPVQAKACAHYLNGYLIRKDANDRGFDLGITVGTDGFVAEGSIESVFIIKDGCLKTPPLGRILESITRKSIIRLAMDHDIPIVETALNKDDLLTADEMFTSHTGIRVSIIKQLENRKFHVPGPITTHIRELLNNVFSFKSDRYSHWFQLLSQNDKKTNNAKCG